MRNPGKHSYLTTSTIRSLSRKYQSIYQLAKNRSGELQNTMTSNTLQYKAQRSKENLTEYDLLILSQKSIGFSKKLSVGEHIVNIILFFLKTTVQYRLGR